MSNEKVKSTEESIVGLRTKLKEKEDEQMKEKKMCKDKVVKVSKILMHKSKLLINAYQCQVIEYKI